MLRCFGRRSLRTLHGLAHTQRRWLAQAVVSFSEPVADEEVCFISRDFTLSYLMWLYLIESYFT
jgi:hypothetical protein